MTPIWACAKALACCVAADLRGRQRARLIGGKIAALRRGKHPDLPREAD
jgi:hypothetical protein